PGGIGAASVLLIPSVPGVEGIGRVDAAVLEVPLDGEPLPRGAAEPLATSRAVLEGVEDGLDHRRAVEAVRVECRALREPLRARADLHLRRIDPGAVGPVRDP